jgi:benzodiazapine receptor
MEFKSVAAGIGIVLVLIYALGSGFWVNNAPGWYTSLNRPSWQPPDFVFGLIWPYNFVILGVAAVRVSNGCCSPLLGLSLLRATPITNLGFLISRYRTSYASDAALNFPRFRCAGTCVTSLSNLGCDCDHIILGLLLKELIAQFLKWFAFNSKHGPLGHRNCANRAIELDSW